MIKSLRNLASIGEYYERGLKMLKFLSSMLEESPFLTKEENFLVAHVIDMAGHGFGYDAIQIRIP